MLFPIRPATLQKGRFLGGFVGIPGVASVLAVLLGLIAYGSQPLLLIVYLVCAVLGLANLMVWARLANRLGIMLSANPRVANVLMIVVRFHDGHGAISGRYRNLPDEGTRMRYSVPAVAGRNSFGAAYARTLLARGGVTFPWPSDAWC